MSRAVPQTRAFEPPSPQGDRLLAYCRPGFEGECAQELTALDAAAGGGGFARAARGSGFVEFVRAGAGGAIDGRRLVFARQLLHVLGHASALPVHDRLSVLLPLVEADPRRWCDAWVEAPDSDPGRALAPLCRGLNAALIAALKPRKLIDRASPWRLHVCLTATDAAFVAVADVRSSTPWPGGIPRLKFPRSAPSRSTLKLEEALLVLLDEGERERWLKPGMRAVDLGASPGGWTWQLVARSLHVTAVDNGPMDAALLASGLVDHLRADGFRYRPPKPVDWLVCDMVEQPRRVAELMAQWLAQGWCRHAIFNLKLPMKKRYDEVELCLGLLRATLSDAGRRLDLRARQLYHDREEITVFARVA
ncbi:MAG: 23S rRNA (cytidine(2498)-2'-O)-methyltransferase RlmM [Rhodanobacteraceae bacterium]|jgi:23S rRNA (cytidine2498-2'-O)-methyltransferase|nr:23S rRNA (cytidine(2498)-2'-O)-methyltransferase RlmM [Rhodanobacteraceae bacterium]